MSWAAIAAYHRAPRADSSAPASAAPAAVRRLDAWLPLAPVLIAALFRFLLLGLKPPHFDEGVNGWFVDEMTKKGFYHYDPSNYHGPLHFYVLFLFQTLFGRHISVLRFPVAAISVATVWLVTRFEPFLNRRTCLVAALAMAVSPGDVFYSRYAIHEAWLVFFMILTAWGFAGLWKWGDLRSLWAAALGLTGMLLTKETAVIHIGCFILATACLGVVEPFSASTAPPLAPRRWTITQFTVVLLVSLGLILFFYSGALLDFSSLRGLGSTLHEWAKTGKEGHGHEKPWDYWLQLMAIYEWPALLGLGASLRFLFPGSNRLLRWLAIYGCGALAAYSIVRYKTPWCVISILWPFFFLFGAFIDDLAGIFHRRNLLYAAVLLLLAASAAESIRLNFFRFVDPDEKYVYVQTLNDLYKLTGPLHTLTARDPANFQMEGNILLASYHPLPWELGDFPHVGYYGSDIKPDAMDADFILAESTRIDEVEKALKHRYFTTDLQLRDGQDPSKLYLDATRFKSLFPGQEPDFIPGAPSAAGASGESDDSDQSDDSSPPPNPPPNPIQP